MDKKTTMSEMMRKLLSFFLVEESGLFFFLVGILKVEANSHSMGDS